MDVFINTGLKYTLLYTWHHRMQSLLVSILVTLRIIKILRIDFEAVFSDYFWHCLGHSGNSPQDSSIWDQRFHSSVTEHCPFPVARLGLMPALVFNSTGSCSSHLSVHSFSPVLQQRQVSIWKILPWEDWKQQQQQAYWWGSSVLFVKVNPLPLNQPQVEGPHSPECQKTWSVPDLHGDWHFRQKDSLCLGDVTAEPDGS